SIITVFLPVRSGSGRSSRLPGEARCRHQDLEPGSGLGGVVRIVMAAAPDDRGEQVDGGQRPEDDRVDVVEGGAVTVEEGLPEGGRSPAWSAASRRPARCWVAGSSARPVATTPGTAERTSSRHGSSTPSSLGA